MESLVLRILYLIAFQCVRLVVDQFECIRCFFNGALKEIHLAQDSINYSRSARLSKVRGSFLFDLSLPNTKRNLIATHEQFVHPEYVLKDEVSLYCVTDTEAFFVEAPPGVEVWRKQYGAFHKEAQHKHSIRLISMPMSSFNKLAKDLGDIKEKLIFVECVPRSGSTLLGQIFENSGVCVNYSEPSMLNNYIYSCPDMEKMKRLLEAAIRFYAKPRKEETSAFVFKIIPMGHSLSQTLHELFPEAYLFHLTRNPIPNVKSMMRAGASVPIRRLWKAVEFIYPKINYIARKNMGLNIMIDNKSDHPLLELLGPQKVWSIVHYLYKERMKTAKYDMPAIKYEDLVENKRANVEAIFRHCGLPADRVDAALTAFDSDSQKGTVVSRSEIWKPKEFFSDPQVEKWRELNDLLHLGDIRSFRIEGTMTVA